MRRLLVALVVLAVIGGAVFWYLTIPKTLAATDLPSGYQADATRGEYLFHASGCASCHADPNVTDTVSAKEMPGGLALASPFGTFYAPNISPDPEHGIGGWTDLEFVNAMKFGVAPDGSHLYPAFPYYSYQHMKVEDLLDLHAYLNTLPPVATSPPAHDLPFPFSLRRGVGMWKLLYVDGETLQDDPALTPEINRGRYLVRGPGHCGECHTPRTFYGGPIESQALAGGPALEGEGSVPNITPHPDGIGDWTEEDFTFNMLFLGMSKDGEPVASGGMKKVVAELGKLTPEDQLAIWHYLRSVPPHPNAVAEKPAEEASPAAESQQ